MQYWKVALFVFLFFAIVIGIAMEIQIFNRYLDAASLLKISLFTGAGVGALLGFLIPRKVYTDRSSRNKVGVFIFFASLILIPYLAFLSNRVLAENQGSEIEAQFINEEGRYGSIGLSKGERVKPNSYQLFFYWKDRIYRIDTQQPHFLDTEKGEAISLAVKTGFWGYQWVDLQ